MPGRSGGFTVNFLPNGKPISNSSKSLILLITLALMNLTIPFANDLPTSTALLPKPFNASTSELINLPPKSVPRLAIVETRLTNKPGNFFTKSTTKPPKPLTASGKSCAVQLNNAPTSLTACAPSFGIASVTTQSRMASNRSPNAFNAGTICGLIHATNALPSSMSFSTNIGRPSSSNQFARSPINSPRR